MIKCWMNNILIFSFSFQNQIIGCEGSLSSIKDGIDLSRAEVSLASLRINTRKQKAATIRPKAETRKIPVYPHPRIMLLPSAAPPASASVTTI